LLPPNPRLAARRIVSIGNISFSSHSNILGAISFSAKDLAKL